MSDPLAGLLSGLSQGFEQGLNLKVALNDRKRRIAFEDQKNALELADLRRRNALDDLKLRQAGIVDVPPTVPTPDFNPPAFGSSAFGHDQAQAMVDRMRAEVGTALRPTGNAPYTPRFAPLEVPSTDRLGQQVQFGGLEQVSDPAAEESLRQGRLREAIGTWSARQMGQENVDPVVARAMGAGGVPWSAIASFQARRDAAERMHEVGQFYKQRFPKETAGLSDEAAATIGPQLMTSQRQESTAASTAARSAARVNDATMNRLRMQARQNYHDALAASKTMDAQLAIINGTAQPPNPDESFNKAVDLFERTGAITPQQAQDLRIPITSATDSTAAGGKLEATQAEYDWIVQHNGQAYAEQHYVVTPAGPGRGGSPHGPAQQPDVAAMVDSLRSQFPNMPTPEIRRTAQAVAAVRAEHPDWTAQQIADEARKRATAKSGPPQRP